MTEKIITIINDRNAVLLKAVSKGEISNYEMCSRMAELYNALRETGFITEREFHELCNALGERKPDMTKSTGQVKTGEYLKAIKYYSDQSKHFLNIYRRKIDTFDHVMGYMFGTIHTLKDMGYINEDCASVLMENFTRCILEE